MGNQSSVSPLLTWDSENCELGFKYAGQKFKYLRDTVLIPKKSAKIRILSFKKLNIFLSCFADSMKIGHLIKTCGRHSNLRSFRSIRQRERKLFKNCSRNTQVPQTAPTSDGQRLPKTFRTFLEKFMLGSSSSQKKI